MQGVTKKIFSSHNEGHPKFPSCLCISMCCNIDPRGALECMLIMVTTKLFNFSVWLC